MLTVAALETQGGVEVTLVSKEAEESAQKGKDPYLIEIKQDPGNWSTLEYAVLPLFQKCWVRNGQTFTSLTSVSVFNLMLLMLARREHMKNELEFRLLGNHGHRNS